jgi:hypothetical protein
MTRDEITLRLMLLKPIMLKPKAYSPAERVEMYSVYNAVTGEKRAVTSCGACLNTVISRLKKELRLIEDGEGV